MKLTKNEKKVLNFLLDDAKITDSLMAKRLNISSQAIGKIRRKLESSIIDSYTIGLNYSKMGIQAFAISLSKLTSDGLDKGELQVEKKLLDVPNIIQIYRLPNSSSTHVIFYGFTDLNSLDNFFHSSRNKEEIFKYIENKELFTFSHNSLIKNNPSKLFQTVIDTTTNNGGKNIPELERFRKKIGE